jgi:hypothetical protein
MDMNKTYADYMSTWIDSLGPQDVEVANTCLDQVKLFWSSGSATDLQAIREQLWSWVDANGGSGNSADKNMLFVRMVLCLAYEDNRELQDMGYFEDLLANWGISRSEINKHGPGNITRVGA